VNFDVDDSRPRVVGSLLLCNKICFVLCINKSLQRNTRALPYVHTHAHTHARKKTRKGAHPTMRNSRRGHRRASPFPLLLFFFALFFAESPRTAKADPEKPKLAWENKEHKHESWDSSFQLCNQTRSKINVLNAVASPGSFAGRTGHSGATKFTIESDVEYKSGKMVRQSWFSKIDSDDDDNNNNNNNEEGGRGGEVSQGIKETVPLCEWTEDCPIGGHGRQTVSGRRAKVPWYTPSGKYRYRYELKDAKGVETLFCVDVTVRVECPEKAYVCPGLPLV
jgi:hypothetical protein